MKPFSVLRLLSSVACLPAIGLAAAGLLSSVAAHAAEPVVLDQSLRYLRITSAVQADELRTALLKPAPIVIDLRYTADDPSPETLPLEFRTQPRKPVIYVLVSPSTPRAMAKELSEAHLMLLGIKGSRPEPTIVIAQPAADDRKAYEALDAGTALADLISGKVDKERFDEASLVSEFKNGNHDAQPPAATSKDKDTPAPRLVDRVLQRAVHLNRAQQALKPRG